MNTTKLMVKTRQRLKTHRLGNGLHGARGLTQHGLGHLYPQCKQITSGRHAHQLVKQASKVYRADRATLRQRFNIKRLSEVLA